MNRMVSLLNFAFFIVFDTFFVLHDIKCDEPSKENSRKVKKVESVTLRPMPYRVDSTYLLDMSLDRRQDWCKQMQSEINDPVVKAQSRDFFVSKAHMYKFDKEEWLAVQCPTVPALYLFHEFIFDDHVWHPRLLNPRTDNYEFNFETVADVVKKSESNLQLELPEDDHLYTIEMEQRWHLCKAARESIQYQIQYSGSHGVGQPCLHQFRYFTGWNEIYHAFDCGTTPSTYLRSSHSGPSNVLTIVLAGNVDLLQRYELSRKHGAYN